MPAGPSVAATPTLSRGHSGAGAGLQENWREREGRVCLACFIRTVCRSTDGRASLKAPEQLQHGLMSVEQPWGPAGQCWTRVIDLVLLVLRVI
jgi:hypothetical protein